MLTVVLKREEDLKKKKKGTKIKDYKNGSVSYNQIPATWTGGNE